MDSKLRKILSELNFDGQQEPHEGVLDRIAEIIANQPEVCPMPRSVPGTLGMTPKEFMEAPMERFSQICESLNYRKVTSSLNYIATFSGNEIPEVIARVNEIRKYLKEWRTGKSPEKDSIAPPKDEKDPTSSESCPKASEGGEDA